MQRQRKQRKLAEELARQEAARAASTLSALRSDASKISTRRLQSAVLMAGIGKRSNTMSGMTLMTAVAGLEGGSPLGPPSSLSPGVDVAQSAATAAAAVLGMKLQRKRTKVMKKAGEHGGGGGGEGHHPHGGGSGGEGHHHGGGSGGEGHHHGGGSGGEGHQHHGHHHTHGAGSGGSAPAPGLGSAPAVAPAVLSARGLPAMKPLKLSTLGPSPQLLSARSAYGGMPTSLASPGSFAQMGGVLSTPRDQRQAAVELTAGMQLRLTNMEALVSQLNSRLSELLGAGSGASGSTGVGSAPGSARGDASAGDATASGTTGGGSGTVGGGGLSGGILSLQLGGAPPKRQPSSRRQPASPGGKPPVPTAASTGAAFATSGSQRGGTHHRTGTSFADEEVALALVGATGSAVPTPLGSPVSMGSLPVFGAGFDLDVLVGNPLEAVAERGSRNTSAATSPTGSPHASQASPGGMEVLGVPQDALSVRQRQRFVHAQRLVQAFSGAVAGGGLRDVQVAVASALPDTPWMGNPYG